MAIEEPDLIKKFDKNDLIKLCMSGALTSNYIERTFADLSKQSNFFRLFFYTMLDKGDKPFWVVIEDIFKIFNNFWVERLYKHLPF